nr:MAG TPA: hypothetical protein [Caudoviricetes sp.]
MRKRVTNKLVITGAGYASDEQRRTQRTITKRPARCQPQTPHGPNHSTQAERMCHGRNTA